MAIRIKKSLKIAPGVRLNISKSGVSTSVGMKGVTANISKKGTRLTGSIPGTGVSSSKMYTSKKPEKTQVERRSYLWLVLVLVGTIGVVIAMSK
nr:MULTISPECIES: DUF4236 domain-containing protein [Pseudomonas]